MEIEAINEVNNFVFTGRVEFCFNGNGLVLAGLGKSAYPLPVRL